METYESALNILFNREINLEKEVISVRDSLNRVLAEDVVLDRDYPDSLRSAVDGYALKFGKDNNFDLIGTVAAGQIHEFELQEGEALFVMTGGIVPESADAVARVEDCESYGSHIFVKKDLNENENINEEGEEAKKGEIIAEKGIVIEKSVFPVLFYGGKSNVKVFKKIDVGVLITGDEINEVEEGYKKGQVFNTNKYIVESFLADLPVNICYEDAVNDNENKIFNLLNEMMNKYDVVITSGGISMGKFDYVKKIFEEQNFNILINKTKIKPGSPLKVAEKNKTLFFGMPGYPSAFTTNLILYLRPFLKKLCGFKDFKNIPVKAKLKNDMKSREGSDYFNRGYCKIENGEYNVYNLNSQKTSHYLNFAKSNCLVHLDSSISNVSKGEFVEIIMF